MLFSVFPNKKLELDFSTIKHALFKKIDDQIKNVAGSEPLFPRCSSRSSINRDEIRATIFALSQRPNNRLCFTLVGSFFNKATDLSLLLFFLDTANMKMGLIFKG